MQDFVVKTSTKTLKKIFQNWHKKKVIFVDKDKFMQIFYKHSQTFI